MNDFLHSAKLGLRAAAKDVSKNLFRPIHNLRVVFGLEKEDSLEELIRKQAEEDRPTPTI